MGNVKQNSEKTILITGANSGLGFATAKKFAQEGYGRIILVCRTLEKGQNAKKDLTQKTGKDVFECIAMDTSEVNSAKEAAVQVQKLGLKLDYILLNAGMMPSAKLEKNSNQVIQIFASTLIGHHVLTITLLKNNILSDSARIVIAGSEAARGDFMGMKIPDFNSVAQKNFDGDIQKTLEAYATGTYGSDLPPMNFYAIAKLYVAWWAAALAEKLPTGIVVTAVSPGSVPSTSFGRNMSLPMRMMMSVIMPIIGPMMGMAGPIENGVQRYVDAASFPESHNGKFYASKPGKLVGKLEQQMTPHLLDKDFHEACWKTLVILSQGEDYS